MQENQAIREEQEVQDQIRQKKACFKNDKKLYKKILKKVRLLLKPIQTKSSSPGGLARLAKAGIHLNDLVEIHRDRVCNSIDKENKLEQLLKNVESELDTFRYFEIGKHDLISDDKFIDELELSHLDSRVINLIKDTKEHKLKFSTVGMSIGAGVTLGGSFGSSVGTARTSYGDSYAAVVNNISIEGLLGGLVSIGQYKFPAKEHSHFSFKSTSDCFSGALGIGFGFGGTPTGEKRVIELIISPMEIGKPFLGMTGIRLFLVKRSTSAFLKNLDITWKNIKLDTREP